MRSISCGLLLLMLRGLSVGLCILSDGHIGEPCKTAEPIEVSFVGVGVDSRGPKEPRMGAAAW